MNRVVGIGLVALDIVIDERGSERLGSSAGGSCGNVLAVLAWLGWDAAPVARLDDAHNADLICRDLARWGVDDRWLRLGATTPAPVFIERLREHDDGTIAHRFERACPHCGMRLPGYRAVTKDALAPVLDDLVAWSTLYVDRPSAGAVALAQRARAEGLLVVFEPSARGTEQHLAALASCADIVKYSADRLTASDREILGSASPPLEIETLGADGLRFRRPKEPWTAMPPRRVTVRDTAGAGDWTTAGLLHALASADARPDALGDTDLRHAVAFAQALGTWSCRFVGARGAMERHTAHGALSAASASLSGERHTARRRRSATHAEIGDWACSSCR